MKTNVALRLFINLLLIMTSLLLNHSITAQTYSTIANGAWSSAATWQGGIIPDATNIPVAAVVNIKHTVTYTGAGIMNNGTITIKNQSGLTPRLIVASGVTFTNNTGAKMYIHNGEYRQYRFVGAGDAGVVQTGSYLNKGGYVEVKNSFVEVADNWSNQNWGSRYVYNSSVRVGNDYVQNSNSIDTLLYSSVSTGWHGAGDFSINGSSIYFQSARIQIASPLGLFKLNGCVANGTIDGITFNNQNTGTTGAGTITVSTSVVTTGLVIAEYCATSAASLITNSKLTGMPSANCSMNYFPAKLFASLTPGALDFSNAPQLMTAPATNLNVGAIYKFEGIAPGIDAILKIDSLINGATITKIDDNSGGLGYVEGFQPEIKAGPAVGQSYAVFTMDYKITGTNDSYPLATFNITALDIDGGSDLKEFDQIIVAPGATLSYLTTTLDIQVTQVAPGSFKGINIAGIERTGIDTASLANMFTVSAKELSTVTLKLGTVKTTTAQPNRQYGIYFKGFVYPNMGTLPVKMESFTATLNKNNKTDLKWTTSSEINTSHFIVERSVDGTNYNEVGVVFAYGNNSSRTNYSFTDDINGLKSTIVYYRLRSVDNDSKGQYSATRIIRVGLEADSKLTIMTYPNPVTNELRITNPSSWQNKQVVYELFNAGGKSVMKVFTGNSSQTERMNVSNIAPGFYILRAICNGETAQQKIIKQ